VKNDDIITGSIVPSSVYNTLNNHSRIDKREEISASFFPQKNTIESPLEKLERLKIETTELIRDFGIVSESSKVVLLAYIHKSID